MTTVVTTARTGPVAASGVTPIPFTFQSISETEIAVIRDGAVADPASYTISRDADGTGEITPLSDWGSDEVIIYSDPNFQQPTEYQRFGAFYPDLINSPLDRLARSIIALNDTTFQLPVPFVAAGMPGLDDTGARTFYPLATFAGPTGPAGDVAKVSTRADMAAIAGPAAEASRWLAESGRHGLFQFDDSDLSTYVAADTAEGLYVAPDSDPTGGSGAWVRQFEPPINPVWFGLVEGDAAGANGAANSAVWTAMMAVLAARGVVYNANHRGLDPVRFPPGIYEFSDTLDIKAGQMEISGWQGGGYRHTVTDLVFPAGVTGIRIQSHDTTGASGPAGASDFGGFGSAIRKLSLHGGYAGAGVEAEAHGIHLRGRAVIEDVFIEAFEGDGIHADATTGDATRHGNVNNTRIMGCRIEDCRKGVYFNGADANICHIEAVDCTSCRQWSFHESSFLGNNYISCHSSGSGTVENGGTPAIVTHGGNRYTVVAGQEVGASTNAPSGTATDNTWWYYLGAGGADATQNIAAWVSGTTYRAGGSYLSDGTGAFNIFIGCYQEGTTGIAQFSDLSLVLLGKMGAYRGGAVLTAASSGYINASLFRVTDTFRAEGASTLFGSETIGNLAISFDNGSSSNTLTFRSTVGGATQTDGVLLTSRNSGMTLRGFGAAGAQGNINLASGTTVVANSKSTGFNVKTGFTYQLNDVQLLTARKTGWAVATGTATRTTFDTATVTLPQLAERVKALIDDLHGTAGHGLIGT
jgi:hypothetical protein